MNKSKSFEFSYINRNVAVLIMILICILWIILFAFTVIHFGNSLSNRNGQILIVFTLTLFLILGECISYKYATYIGKATLNATDVKLDLKFKSYTIPYDQIKKIQYYSYKSNSGVIIKIKGFKRIDFKYNIKNTAGLDKFSTALKERITN